MDKRESLPDNLKELYDNLAKLNDSLNDFTASKYKRVNPFFENIVDWKRKGEKYTGDATITIYDSATLIGDVKIGGHTWVGPFCMLDGSGGLSIGSFCSISSGVMIFTHDTVKWALSGGFGGSPRGKGYEYAPVSIGDNCFIGTQTVIIKGVAIGNRCLVGANSLVNKDMPDNSIFAGVPARQIGEVIIKDDDVDFNYF